jgi:hypothetical protein
MQKPRQHRHAGPPVNLLIKVREVGFEPTNAYAIGS